MSVFVIIITNILIALFGETLQNKETKGHQMYNRANLVIETSYDLPFSTMNMFVQPLLFVWAMLTTLPAILHYRFAKKEWPKFTLVKRFIWTKARINKF